MKIPSIELVLIMMIEEWGCGSLSCILLRAVFLHKIDDMFQSINFVNRLIVNVFPLSNETAVGCLQLPTEIELVQDIFDAVLNVTDDAAASLEEFNIIVVYIVIFL